MSRISLKWFGGMVPRRGEQHLYRTPQATEAENCNLYSGELRPLKKPSLSHQFCRPEEECWRSPLPDDPSVPPPDPPPEPPLCVPVAIQSQSPATLYLGDKPLGTLITLSITVNADATEPLQYQWYRNGIAIANAVSSAYQFTAAAEDAYAAYTVSVQNPCGLELAESWSLGNTDYICLQYACDAIETALNGDPDYTTSYLYRLYEGAGPTIRAILASTLQERIETETDLVGTGTILYANPNPYAADGSQLCGGNTVVRVGGTGTSGRLETNLYYPEAGEGGFWPQVVSGQGAAEGMSFSILAGPYAAPGGVANNLTLISFDTWVWAYEAGQSPSSGSYVALQAYIELEDLSDTGGGGTPDPDYIGRYKLHTKMGGFTGATGWAYLDKNTNSWPVAFTLSHHIYSTAVSSGKETGWYMDAWAYAGDGGQLFRSQVGEQFPFHYAFEEDRSQNRWRIRTGGDAYLLHAGMDLTQTWSLEDHLWLEDVYARTNTNYVDPTPGCS